MSICTPPISIINANGIVIIVILFILFLLTCVEGLIMRRFKGRTTREFQLSENVWGILDRWAGMKKYKLVNQDENSRTYRRRGFRTTVMIPKVQITSTGSNYRLEAWMTVRSIWRFFPALMFPRELVIDVKSFWIGWDWHPLDSRYIASKDVNALIQMLNVGIEPIPQ